MIAGWRRRAATAMPVGLLTGVAALAVAFSAPGVWAQGEDEAPHPIHIHTGSCDELGDIVAPLGDVAPVADGEVEGATSAIPVQISETEVDLTLAAILGDRHAINVHESEAAIDEYIACGDVGGRVDGGRLVVGLQEMNGSDFSGVAVLEEDGAETEVTVYLFEEGTAAREEPAATATPDEAAATAPAAGESTATAEADEAATAEPEDDATAEPTEEDATAESEAATATAEPEDDETATAQPEEEDATATTEPEEDAEETATAGAEAALTPAGEEVAVDIRNFAFDPDPIEIAVGDSVTWTNQDGVPHTTTARDRDVLQSGAIQPGDSNGQTFEEAGEFAYFCEFHAGMTGTIVVE